MKRECVKIFGKEKNRKIKIKGIIFIKQVLGCVKTLYIFFNETLKTLKFFPQPQPPPLPSPPPSCFLSQPRRPANHPHHSRFTNRPPSSPICSCQRLCRESPLVCYDQGSSPTVVSKHALPRKASLSSSSICLLRQWTVSRRKSESTRLQPPLVARVACACTSRASSRSSHAFIRAAPSPKPLAHLSRAACQFLPSIRAI